MLQSYLFFFLALSLSVEVFAQSPVSTNGLKYVLVEEATGSWCANCADGAVYLDKLLHSNPQVICVSIHGGSGADQMKFADGNGVISSYFTDLSLLLLTLWG